MAASKTPVSHASSYREIGEFWDKHSLSEHWQQTREVEFDVDIQSSAIYFAVERSLAERLRSAAEDRGISPDELLKELVEERIGNSSSK
jgi:EAL domain-containing protein (putative c-di-GMP-specific phosphodiesterase class I)